MEEGFRQWGMTIPNLSMVYGSGLAVWGIFAYLVQSADPPSMTALIPAFMGAPLLLTGALSKVNPKNNRHYMHAALLVATLMAVAGGYRLIRAFSDMSTLGLVSHILLVLVGVTFVYAGVKSFRHARLMREG
ncbi:MAG: hypothetical protein CMB42_04120 [Euryarchaeota archaeon]|nr:hypothetical protein [Euryarchaeota archaeon]|tara:strand:- start:23281 stop:23676 length:396 start_codon:yes stop_codon:yes gene_type:complete